MKLSKAKAALIVGSVILMGAITAASIGAWNVRQEKKAAAEARASAIIQTKLDSLEAETTTLRGTVTTQGAQKAKLCTIISTSYSVNRTKQVIPAECL